MLKVYLKLFMCVVITCFGISLFISGSELNDIINNFRFITIVVFTAFLFLLFLVRYEAGELLARKFNEPGLKDNFPRVILPLVIVAMSCLSLIVRFTNVF